MKFGQKVQDQVQNAKFKKVAIIEHQKVKWNILLFSIILHITVLNNSISAIEIWKIVVKMMYLYSQVLKTEII